ncbi:glutathione S-transferase [Cryptococcus deuterogattii 99/473]|uniref:Glutathione S-transferase n=2 Tax=Cryptococcus deuterogattii TaxID=1859096 RepID=A0A0D0VBK3_9TREE|nr:glutathione S-transferase [Cryptococcus deuterogattii R265]KIR30042.1 glutathione S-transferase [Cryptococcus deuterogattii LA55]KIR37371.1 glutathione S-transferase [Cryptococcus deuterogattii MMRL2647]KIR43839.1 glutathione S-transferase [Cryptococcus deuterogattii Ram5]KIR75171.1 glutathione S-transferase [Cryptococcus deuterogattii CA1014]KIR92840.1 glutathione S-transferase [Cryptococcus deuterogattii CBS 10090]KIR98162.1 glutathione S-transferase [Cryptococcus deuterogattii 2001/935-
MSAITLPAAFPVVGIPLFATFALNTYQQILVSKARKESGVKYPTLYAPEAEAAVDARKMKFNCCQRAHANTLENVPYVLALFGFLSVFHPKVASAAMLMWIVGRFRYTAGYASGDPEKRINTIYKISYLGLFTLVFGTLGVAVQKSYSVLF